MAKAKEIKRRIRTVKNIEKITSAMKMIASARLKKAQDRAESARPYAEKMQTMMSSLAGVAGSITHPLLENREENKVAYVIITADRGMAGSYNVNILNSAVKELSRHRPEDVRLFLIGRKAIGFFKNRPYEVVYSAFSPGTDVSFAGIRGVVTRVRGMFEKGEIDAVYLIYSQFVSTMKQKPVSLKLLPISSPETGQGGGFSNDFLFEPPAEMLLGTLLPRYVDTQVYQALVEAQASEQAARMSAMTAASKNAGEMIDSLTLEYNKARQTAITTEILEIVSGAEALK